MLLLRISFFKGSEVDIQSNHTVSHVETEALIESGRAEGENDNDSEGQIANQGSIQAEGHKLVEKDDSLTVERTCRDLLDNGLATYLISSLLRKEAHYSLNSSLCIKPDDGTDQDTPSRRKSEYHKIYQMNKNREDNIHHEKKSICINNDNHMKDNTKRDFELLNKANEMKEFNDESNSSNGEEIIEKKKNILDSKYKFLIDFLNNFASGGSSDSEKILTYVRSRRNFFFIL